MDGEKSGRLRGGGLAGDLAYRALPGRGPGVLFCPGFHSDMGGTKAEALARWCAARGRQFTRFDYRGHGLSDGAFSEGTIGGWLADTLAIIDRVAAGPQVLVGSSMGGWLALLAALARPERVRGLLCIAPAPDFTERLYRDRLDDAQRRALELTGECRVASDYDPEPYTITRQLLEEARAHFLLRGPIALDQPLRIIQGQRDDAVPWRLALELAERVSGSDVELLLIKDGDHRLSSPADLARMLRTLETLLESIGPEG